jgi:hypothetical protein
VGRRSMGSASELLSFITAPGSSAVANEAVSDNARCARRASVSAASSTASPSTNQKAGKHYEIPHRGSQCFDRDLAVSGSAESFPK